MIDLAGGVALVGVPFIARDGEMPVGEVVLARWWVRFALLFPSALAQLTAAHYGPGEHKYRDAQGDAYDDGKPVVEDHLLGMQLFQRPHTRALGIHVL